MHGPSRLWCGAGAMGALAFLAACASDPPPDDALASAEVAYQQAEAAGAAANSPAEMMSARSKLDQARQAVTDERYSRARRLAEEAQADSQLALAKSRAATAEANTQSMRDTLDALREDATPVVPPGGATVR